MCNFCCLRLDALRYTCSHTGIRDFGGAQSARVAGVVSGAYFRKQHAQITPWRRNSHRGQPAAARIAHLLTENTKTPSISPCLCLCCDTLKRPRRGQRAHYAASRPSQTHFHFVPGTFRGPPAVPPRLRRTAGPQETVKQCYLGNKHTLIVPGIFRGPLAAP